MARFNEILVGRYNRLMQKLLSMKGPAALVSLNEEMHVTFPLFSGVENRYLEGWNHFAVVSSIAGAAGFSSQLRIRNLPNSNVVAVLEKVTISSTLSTQALARIVIGGTQTDLVATLGNAALDSRILSASSSLSLSTSNSQATVGTAIWSAFYPANGSADVIGNPNQELELLPNTFYTFDSEVVAQTLLVSIKWRERFLEDSERT